MNCSDGVRGGLSVDDACRFAEAVTLTQACDMLVVSGGDVQRNGFYMLRGRVPLLGLAAASASVGAWLKAAAVLLFGRCAAPSPALAARTHSRTLARTCALLHTWPHRAHWQPRGTPWARVWTRRWAVKEYEFTPLFFMAEAQQILRAVKAVALPGNGSSTHRRTPPRTRFTPVSPSTHPLFGPGAVCLPSHESRWAPCFPPPPPPPSPSPRVVPASRRVGWRRGRSGLSDHRVAAGVLRSAGA
jgi:hypothetical protein